MAEPAFDLTGKVAVVSGGYGVLGGAMASDLALAGARVAVLGRRAEAAAAKVEEIRAAGGDAFPIVADVLDEQALKSARDRLIEEQGKVDILVNAAGGNVARSRSDTVSIFEVPFDSFDEVLRLNLHGSVVPTLIFGESMAKAGKGSIVNISSMAALTAISGVMGYSAAKAAIDNFTRWMAVELARRHGGGVRVNAVAPGFFLSEQNRKVLVNPDGSYTRRAETIIAHTPMGRLGDPSELTGAVRWLCSDSASFVTGTVIPIDGGFSVFGGV